MSGSYIEVFGSDHLRSFFN